MAECLVGVLSPKIGRRFGFSWEIPVFFSQLKIRGVEMFSSPVFPFLDSNWKLLLHAKRFQNGAPIQIDVSMCDSRSGSKTVFCTVWLKRRDGKVEAAKTERETFCLHQQLGFYLDGLNLSYLHQRRLELLPNGTLTIMCLMDGFEQDVPRPLEIMSLQASKLDVPRPVESATEPSNPLADKDKLVADLKGLLLSGDASDAIVRAKGREFRVHRAILGARTPVFCTMFRHDMKESSSGVVEIDDCEPDTFQRFLQYVYTGAVEDLNPDNATFLYEAADKYQVETLKERCLDCIKIGLSAETFCEAIALAIKHDERELTRLATRFLADNFKKIIPSDQWKRFLHDNPTEANELLVKALCIE